MTVYQITRRDPPEKSFEEEVQEYKDGNIDVQQLIDDYGRGEEGYRLVKMADADEISLDDETKQMLLVSAARSGVEEASWRVMSGPKQEGSNPLSYFDDKMRVLEDFIETKDERTVDEVTTVCDIGESEPRLLQIMERAENDENIAALLMVKSHRDYDREGFERWAEKASPDYDAEKIFMRAHFVRQTYLETGDPEKLKEFVSGYERSADMGFADAQYEMGVMLFSGRFMERNLARSYRYLKAAAKSGDEEAKRFLGIFLDEVPEAVPSPEEGETIGIYQSPKTFDRGFNIPTRDLVDAPEWQVLMEITESEYHGHTYIKSRRNETGGYENDVFAVSPFYWGEAFDRDYEKLSDRPNFLFKPTGFSIEWYKYPFRDSHMSEDLDSNQLRHIWRICIESVVRDFSEGAFI